VGREEGRKKNRSEVKQNKAKQSKQAGGQAGKQRRPLTRWVIMLSVSSADQPSKCQFHIPFISVTSITF
jgi:hypothetical protein